MRLPTVSVQHPDDPDVMMIINECDFQESYVRWGDPGQDLTVGKGPRGKFYVKRGKELVFGPFETVGEAEARLIAS